MVKSSHVKSNSLKTVVNNYLWIRSLNYGRVMDLNEYRWTSSRPVRPTPSPRSKSLTIIFTTVLNTIPIMYSRNLRVSELLQKLKRLSTTKDLSISFSSYFWSLLFRWFVRKQGHGGAVPSVRQILSGLFGWQTLNVF